MVDMSTIDARHLYHTHMLHGKLYHHMICGPLFALHTVACVHVVLLFPMYVT